MFLKPVAPPLGPLLASYWLPVASYCARLASMASSGARLASSGLPMAFLWPPMVPAWPPMVSFSARLASYGRLWSPVPPVAWTLPGHRLDTAWTTGIML